MADKNAFFLKNSGAILDYKIDWSLWLTSETISTSDFVADSGITITNETNTTTTSTVWLSGGTPGETYTVTNTITTSAGRTETQEIEIRVK